MARGDVSGMAAQRAIYGISGIFFLNGAMIGSLSTHFAAIKANLGVDAGTFSLVVMAMAVGTITMLSVGGMVLGRFGSAAVVRVCTVLAPVLFVLPTQLDSTLAVACALLLLGASTGLMDTAMNVHASLCERVSGRLAMVRIHAAWSIGGIAGALSTGAILAHVAPTAHAIGQGVVIIAAGLICRRVLLPAATDRGQGNRRLSLPGRALYPIAAMAFLLMFCAAAMRDWSAIHLRESFAADYQEASYAFAAFSALTAAGRLFGDRLRTSIGDRSLLILGGVGGGLVLGAGLAFADATAMILAIGLFGLCHAILTPLLFSVAGKHGGGAAAGNIASVMMIGFLGYLVDPPAIGLIAEAQGLGLGLGLAVVASLGVGLIAWRNGLAGR